MLFDQLSGVLRVRSGVRRCGISGRIKDVGAVVAGGVATGPHNHLLQHMSLVSRIHVRVFSTLSTSRLAAEGGDADDGCMVLHG